MFVARSVYPTFEFCCAAGFLVCKDGTVLTITTVMVSCIIGLYWTPLGEAPRGTVSPLPVSLLYSVCCSNPHKVRGLYLQNGSCGCRIRLIDKSYIVFEVVMDILRGDRGKMATKAPAFFLCLSPNKLLLAPVVAVAFSLLPTRRTVQLEAFSRLATFFLDLKTVV